MTEKKTLTYAREYLERGYSVIPVPIRSKEATIKWGEYQKRLPTDDEITEWFSNGNTNIALVLGKVSGNGYTLVGVDHDALDRWAKFRDKAEDLLSLKLADITPINRSSRGNHTLWYVKNPVKSYRIENDCEIRSDGNYIIIPPSYHPGGKQYEWLNPEVRSPYIIETLADIGIEPQGIRIATPQGGQPNWITEALKGIDDGNRGRTCFRLAGHLKNSQGRDITEALLLDWNKKNRPPMEEDRVLREIASAYTYNNPNTAVLSYSSSEIINRYREFENPPKKISLESGQYGGQSLDNMGGERRDKGDLSEPFENFLRDNPQWHDKRYVAECIGTRYTDQAFIKIIQRWSKSNPLTGESPKIQVSANGQRIRWINNDWRSNLILPATESPELLDIKLPFGMEQLVDVPPRTVMVCGGEVESGKSHYAYQLADLNVNGKLPIRHFFNELGGARARLWLDDYPYLKEAWLANDGRYSLINLDDIGNGELDIIESFDPNGLNIFDYLHIGLDKEWFLTQANTMRQCAKRLENGFLLVNMQKPPGLNRNSPYGGDTAKFQCDIQVALYVLSQSENRTECRLGIEKAKDYQGTANRKVNPKSKCIRYHTAPKYGQLVPEIEGWQSNEK